MRIGVLSIQGSVAEHLAALSKCGVEAVPVKDADTLKKVQGLILPGGESTTIGKLLKRFGLGDAIKKAKIPLYGTCAGAILMAQEILNDVPEYSLDMMDITICRNAYGAQQESFVIDLEVPIFGKKKVPAYFIRAPKIVRVGKGCEVLAKLKKDPVLVRQGNLLVSTFHPELTEDLRVHRYFVEMCR
ncbi:MAG: pyridoxal 5'-phosphate synthase glutaminase subunit PdxT [Candidatus Gracilibacteria bacterium]|nr:pyridoxal 5'-phosphate synthase glutaminase subunit PdxT [Candidatus Gracilibacteria bacterium]